jgi:non-ribosomal peptide synthetase component F
MAQIHPQKVAVVLDHQAWTYSELIEQVEHVVFHLRRLNISPGQIIYQFVERGFEMVCGSIGIMCAGGVYCPLNPSDPAERLATIFEQIPGQYVLLHGTTRNQFPNTGVQQFILFEKVLSTLLDVKDMTELPECREHGAALIMCTSGTTGRPKAIVHTFKSFSACIFAYIQWNLRLYTIRDHVLQVAACSWILHLSEILLPLVVGGTLVLLRPGGHLDMSYFSQTLINQQVTTLTTGSGIVRALTNYLEMSQQFETFKFVRNLCATGDYKLFIYSPNCVYCYSF